MWYLSSESERDQSHGGEPKGEPSLDKPERHTIEINFLSIVRTSYRRVRFFAAMRINLQVPYEEKDQAKLRGARWDPARRTWYIQDPESLYKFWRWIPQHLKRPVYSDGNSPKTPTQNKNKNLLPDEYKDVAEDKEHLNHLRDILKEA